MTDYELLELRHNYRAETASAFRYWVSLNFAILVAAYAVGPHLNLLTVSVILTLYVMVTFTNQRVLQTIGADQQALEEQIKQTNDTTVAINPVMNVSVKGAMGNRSFVIVGLMLRASLFVGTIFFVINQAGYIG